MASKPTIKIELAFGQGWADVPPLSWTDVSAYLETPETISIERGRGDEFDETQAGRIQLTLNNPDGRFTPGYASGAYYPDIRKGVPLRFTATWDANNWVRFMGFVDDWPVIWPNGLDVTSNVTITATGLLGRLGRSATFRSIIEHEFLADSPSGYWPLTESEGATRARDASGNRRLALTIGQTGSKGTLTFGEATGPTTDGQGAPLFEPVDDGNGKRLQRTFPDRNIAPANKPYVYGEIFFATEETGTGGVNLFTWDDPNSNENLYVDITLTGNVFATANIHNGAGGYTFFSCTTSGKNFADGAVHHVVAYLERASATQFTLKLRVDAGTHTDTDGPYTVQNDGSNPAPPLLRRLRLGGYFNGNVYKGMLAHHAIYTRDSALTTARLDAHANAGLNGFADENVEQRLQRYAGYLGLPTAYIAADVATNPVAHIDINGRQPLEAMRIIEQSDFGTLYENRVGEIAFDPREYRFENLVEDFTLDAGDGEVGAELEFRLDDQFLVNDITAKETNGDEIARVYDQASIDLYGPYVQELEIAVTSEDTVIDAINWRLENYKNPTVRAHEISVDLYAQDTATVSNILSSDIGYRIRVENLPSQAPNSAEEFFIEGIREEISPTSWIVTFTVSPAVIWDVWVLGDSNRGVLGTTTKLGY